MTSESVVIYARQSFDRRGDELAVDRQLERCREYAAKQDWTVAAEYVDNDKSATTGKPRPAFERLLESRPARVVVWHNDRLIRTIRDLERVIELETSVHALKAGIYDLSTPTGRAYARIGTAIAQMEGEHKADRQREANDQRADAGLPYKGHRAFGWEPDGMTIREPEAAEIRAAAEGLLRGRSLSSMVRSLNERGILTASGKTWRTTSLRVVLLSPRNAGLRRHRGEVVGKAKWPAILDEATATAVRAFLTDSKRSQRGPSRKYLLSGVMTCGKCGGPIVGAFVKDSNKGETYRCHKLHVTRKAPPVDKVVTGLVVARLSQPDARELLARPDGRDEVADLTARQDALRGRLDGLAEAFAAGDIDREALRAGSKRLQTDLEDIDARIVSALEDPGLGEVITADDVATAFDSMPIERKRKIIDRLLTIELLPVGSGKRSRTFDPEKNLKIEWRQG